MYHVLTFNPSHLFTYQLPKIYLHIHSKKKKKKIHETWYILL